MISMDLLDRLARPEPDSPILQLLVDHLINCLGRIEYLRRELDDRELAILRLDVRVHGGRSTNEHLEFADHLDAGDIASDDDEVEQSPLLLGIVRGIRQFKQLNGSVPDRDGVAHVLDLNACSVTPLQIFSGRILVTCPMR